MDTSVTSTETGEPRVNPRDPARALDVDGRPARRRRARLWADVPDEQWDDRRWQLSHRVDSLGAVLTLTDEERDGVSAPGRFRVDITPHFLSLIDPDDAAGPSGATPQTYAKHDSTTGAFCRHQRPEPGPGDVHALLQGDRIWIEPNSFEEIHTRGNQDGQRLQDPSKWVPYGVGAIEGQISDGVSSSGRTELPVLTAGAPRDHRTYGPVRSRGRVRASRARWRMASCCSTAVG